ncbi:hypothetical protein BVX97_04465, partial [bacterium E08(2017)]
VWLILFGKYDSKKTLKALKQMNSWKEKDAFHKLQYAYMEQSDNRDAVVAFLKKNNINLKSVLDSNGAFSKAFDAKLTPMFVLVDKYGNSRYRGPQPEQDELDEWIYRLKGEKTNPALMGAVAMYGSSVVTRNGSILLSKTVLPDCDGTEKPLSSYMGEKGMAVVFGDTTCPDAQVAIKDLVKVGPKLEKCGISPILVNVNNSKTDVLKKYKKRKNGAPVVYDEGTDVIKRWQLESVPHIFVVTADYDIVYDGVALWKDMAKSIEDKGLARVKDLDIKKAGTRKG